MEKEKPLASGSFKESVKTVKNKIGSKKLTNDDILVLAAESILHSYTFEEKDYAQDE